MAKDFYLNPISNDIDLTNNTMRLTGDLPESSRQQVLINLSTFKGEWYANVNAGIPYLANNSNPIQLMGQSETTNFDIAIKNSILSRENVQLIKRYTSEFNRYTRVLTVSFTYVTNTGEEIEIQDLLINV